MKLFIRGSYLSLGLLLSSEHGQAQNIESAGSGSEGIKEYTSLQEVFNGTTPVVPHEEDNEVSIEGLITWRSEYVYRGFRLAGSSFESQLAGQIIISDSEWVDLGLFYGSATGSGDFSEVAAFVDYNKEIGDYTVSAKLMFNEHDNSIFRSALSADIGVAYQFNDAFSLKSLVSYDHGARGFYTELKLEYYEEVDQNSFVIWNAGISATADYYDSSGIHHAFTQLSYTYNVNETVSLTPYITASLAVDDEIDSSLLGGAYFSVSF